MGDGLADRLHIGCHLDDEIDRRRHLRGSFSTGLIEDLEPLDAPELGHHRLQGEHHVRPGVTIGHRVDVKTVDHLLVCPQNLVVGRHDPGDVGRPQPPEYLHLPDANLDVRS